MNASEGGGLVDPDGIACDTTNNDTLEGDCLTDGSVGSAKLDLTDVYDFKDGVIRIQSQASTCPTLSCDSDAEKGYVCVDTSATSGQQFYVCEGLANGWVLQGDGGGGSVAWSALTAPTAATTYDASDNTETVTFNFDVAFTTGSQFSIIQDAGTPSGGILFEVKATDADVKVATIWDGTDGVEVTAAGVLQKVGGGTIVATSGDDAAGFFSSGVLETAYGGTGIAYFTAAGPTVARVYTFPDAAATVLTDNAAVTPVQGGTGDDTSGTTGIPEITAGNWTYAAGPLDLANVGTINDGDYCQGNASSGFDCDVTTIPDADLPSELAYEDEANTFASAGTQIFNDPVDIKPDATNGVEITAAGLLQKTGTGSVKADAVVCTTNCIETAEITNGTIDPDDVNADLKTRRVAQVILLDPDIADEIVFRLPPWAGTMTRIDCEAYGGTSVTINVCDGEDTGDDTCTTSIPGATMTCTTSGVNDTSLTNPGFVARDKLTLVLTAESGTVDSLEVFITGTIN
jgi:hypothetical protein